MSNTGQKLWHRAKSVIPGGNMLLSKRAEMFLPEHWPAYFSKTSGNQIWDMDGNQYTDMLFAVGANTLGYGHQEVDEAVLNVMKDGNLSSLNAPEEVYLAEKLVDMHPWADMARFARSGGEAAAIAVRIARAASGKDKVAFCGYHGWHDWYLSANLANDENLKDHLLPGLEPSGVPQNLAGTMLPFEYNQIDQLEAIISNHEIGVVVMEVCRNFGPEDNFLEKVRALTSQKGIVLIFDECTSGFRQTFGGLHKQYGVNPDMAIFGKAIANGYALTATIGKKEIMEAAQSTFISSTFWTERIGSAAALKTLEVMEKESSWEVISSRGKLIKQKWKDLAEGHSLSIEISGLDALASFSVKSERALEYKTYITQEMLKAGFLASNIIYVATVHTDDCMQSYLNKLDEIFKEISMAEAVAEAEPVSGQSNVNLLDGEICHAGFKRLN